jgi:hypothetical protein
MPTKKELEEQLAAYPAEGGYSVIASTILVESMAEYVNMEEGHVTWHLPSQARTAVQGILNYSRPDYEALRTATQEQLAAMEQTQHGANVSVELRNGRVPDPERNRPGLEARTTGALLATAVYFVRHRMK